MKKYLINMLKEWKRECRATTIVQFSYNYITGILIIYTSQPGYFIGKSGCYINKYLELCKRDNSSFNNIEIYETDMTIIN